MVLSGAIAARHNLPSATLLPHFRCRMPIEVGIWKLAEKPQRVTFSSIDSELKLEDVLCKDLSILAPQLMLIGRQITTEFGSVIDLLAMDADGNLTVVELKRNRTPREVVAQILDYGSWIENLSYEQIAEIFAEKNKGTSLESAYVEHFNSAPPEKLNQSHSLIVVASELDPATERIIDYLSEGRKAVRINSMVGAGRQKCLTTVSPWRSSWRAGSQ